MIPGFVINGSGSKRLLIRGIDPTLGLDPFNIDGALINPTLSLLSGSGLILSNTGWSTAPNAPEIAMTAEAVGAFPLPAECDDRAILVDLPPGSYTVQLAGPHGETGVGLVELYDVDHAEGPSRLANISARSRVGIGSDVLIAG